MQIPFSLRGRRGLIEVSCQVNDDPTNVGCDLLAYEGATDRYIAGAAGYPVCTATVQYPGHGYTAAMGWIQLVRATDGRGGLDQFDMDPLAFYRDLATPFCWFGITPILFDAPFRLHRQPMTWLAHSFLCFSPTAIATRHVRAVTGFGWGFEVRNGDVHMSVLKVIDAGRWNDHLPLLRQYPGWRFDSGYWQS